MESRKFFAHAIYYHVVSLFRLLHQRLRGKTVRIDGCEGPSFLSNDFVIPIAHDFVVQERLRSVFECFTHSI